MALVNHWTLQDNAASTVIAAAVGTAATLNGGDNTSVLSQADGPGTNYPRSLLFNGVDDAIDMIGDISSYPAGTAFSVSAWVKPGSMASDQHVMGTTASGAGRITLGSAASVIVRLLGATVYTFNLASGFAAGSWQHLLVTRTAGDSLRAFRDGVESTTGAQATSSTFGPNKVGRSISTYYSGQIADVRVYNSDESSNVLTIMAEAGLDDPDPPAATGPLRRMLLGVG
jgi:hypothetical protein